MVLGRFKATNKHQADDVMRGARQVRRNSRLEFIQRNSVRHHAHLWRDPRTPADQLLGGGFAVAGDAFVVRVHPCVERP